MRQLFAKLFRRTDRSALRSARKSGVRLGVENLERRDVPSNVPVLSNGILSMKAGDQGDTIHVQIDKNDPGTKYDDEVLITWTRGNGNVDVYTQKMYGGSQGKQQLVKELHVEGGNGNDTIVNDTSLISVLRGGKGNDTLKGGSAADLMEGGLGSDVLEGRDGNDHLYALTKDGTDSDLAVDVLKGGNGDDFLFGGRGGGNFLYGGKDNDVLLGGYKAVQNLLYGEDGDDYLGGGDAGGFADKPVLNIMVGGEGSDTLQGGFAAINFFYAAETGTSGPGHMDVISTGQSKFAWWTVEKQDAAGFWLPDQVVHNITINPPPCEAGPWTV